MTEREIFFEALEMDTPEARAAYLQGACGRDATLRRKVDELLKEHFSNDSLLAGPAVEGERIAVGEAPAEEAPAQMLGRYELLEKIGEGGFGEVWMAEQREPVKRRVALKIIKLGMDSRQIVARFEAERQALAMMEHPNIAKIFDAGATDTGRPYFVMELVRGIKITEYCDQNQLPTQERLRLFILVCQAIQHAHQKGIIHRDIKPSNILVTLHDGVPVPKVIDFGIAKATQQDLTDKTAFTQFQQFIGTPAYISPEQAEMSGLDIDTRADIYSLGVLLYVLLVGQTPFDAKEMMQGGLDVMRQTIREKDPLRPSTRLNTLPGAARTTAGKLRQTDAGKLVHQLQGDLDWIVMKCLEKDRTRRYDTANGLASDIQRHLSNEPVAARPPSATYKFQKAWQRNKLVFTAGAVVVLALVVGIGVSIWQTTLATRAARAESRQRLAAEAEQQRADMQAQKAFESQQHSRRLLYAAEMNLAQQTLKQDNLGRARRLLDRHRPQPGEEDLRGWEWRYLWHLTRSSALVTLTNRPLTRGWSVSFSPDGSHLAVGWYDGRVELWNITSRQLIRVLTDGINNRQGLVAFSPVQNLLVATSERKVVSLYDLDSGRQSVLWRGPDKGIWKVRDLAFSQDGSKAIIYAADEDVEDAVWVVNVSSSKIEHHQPIGSGAGDFHGGGRLSPDNRRLYFTGQHNIQCLDLTTGKEVWQTERDLDEGFTALALSSDGKLIASSSGFEGVSINVWDAATGRRIARLDGHNGFVCHLEFTRDGRRLISSASDQTIRFWDAGNWSVTRVLRGHTEEVRAIAVSESTKLLASAGKDGNLLLWRDDKTNVPDGYRRLPSDLTRSVVLMDGSRALLLSASKPPELADLKRDDSTISLTELGFSSNVLAGFSTNILCHWDGTNRILVRELQGDQFIQRGAIALDFPTRPTGFTYNPAHQLLAWTKDVLPASVYVASLATPDRRIELRNDFPGRVVLRFSEDGKFLLAFNGRLRAWNLETGDVMASIDDGVVEARFAVGGRILIASVHQNIGHEVRFHDLLKPDQAARRHPGRDFAGGLAVSPDGRLVASSFGGSRGRLFEPVKGELIEGVLIYASAASAFSPDGNRLLSTKGGRDAAKLWDVGTWQELLTLPGTGSLLGEARWSTDGDVILAGPPWQAWRAPSWEEIAAAEAKEKMENNKP